VILVYFNAKILGIPPLIILNKILVVLSDIYTHRSNHFLINFNFK